MDFGRPGKEESALELMNAVAFTTPPTTRVAVKGPTTNSVAFARPGTGEVAVALDEEGVDKRWEYWLGDEWYCYTLNTTGSEFGYGLGRKVSKTRHTVLGRHTETGLPQLSGLGSGGPTLQHRMIPGQVPAQTGKAQELLQRKTTLVIIGRMSNRKETGTQGVASLDRGIGAGLFPEAWPRGTTPRVGNRCIVADSSKAQGDTVEPRGQETRGMMLPLASSSLTPDYGDELWALPAHDRVSVSPTYPRCLQRL